MLKGFLVRLFVILGPLGTIATPGIFPAAFRTYYFILLGFPFLLTPLDKKQQKILFLLMPVFIYAFLSSSCAHFLSPEDDLSLMRWALLLFQFLFVLGAASYVKNQVEILSLYLKSFFLSLIINIVFFIGFYLDIFSFATIERFSVLGQFGYGLLRFSIGSYPNEYGIVASFVASVLFLMIIDEKHRIFSKIVTVFYLALTLMAVILTTTRSAYISCCMSFLAMAWIKKRTLAWAFFMGVFALILLKIFNISLINFIIFGFDVDQISQGSMGTRLVLWDQAWQEFLSHGFFGKGFATFTDLHNVYLQLLVELGVIGCLLLISALILAFCHRGQLSLQDVFLQRVKRLAMAHVLWFALTNHNLNHHLTWFAILLYLSSKTVEKHLLDNLRS